MSNIKIEHVVLVNNKIMIHSEEFSKIEVGVLQLPNDKIQAYFDIFNSSTAYKYKININPKKILRDLKRSLKHIQIQADF